VHDARTVERAIRLGVVARGLAFDAHQRAGDRRRPSAAEDTAHERMRFADAARRRLPPRRQRTFAKHASGRGGTARAVAHRTVRVAPQRGEYMLRKNTAMHHQRQHHGKWKDMRLARPS
jgi:hypothetical protein